MPDWSTLASLATAGGTLILALATFSSTRSANHAARVSERSLLAGLRPVLMPARRDDPSDKVRFADGHWIHLSDGMASVEQVGGSIYLAMPLRNVASGIAVLHSWHLSPDQRLADQPHAALDEFRRLSRDLYIPAGGNGYWQGALRDPSDPLYAPVREAVADREPLTIDLLYGDHEGGQRTVSRFVVSPAGAAPEDEAETDGVQRTQWLCAVARHWNLDRGDPR